MNATRTLTTCRAAKHMNGESVSRGDIGEAKFDVIAMSLGYVVSSPKNKDSPYDHILDNGDDLFRIQTKTSETVKETKAFGPSYFFSLGHSVDGEHNTPYAVGSFHYWVLHVADYDAWWVIPFTKLRGLRGVRMHPAPEHDEFREYRSAWHLFGRPDRALHIYRA